MERMGLFENMLEVNVVAAIWQHIEQLAAEDTLSKFDVEMKRQFKDVFELVVNVQDLLRDILTKIQLKKADYCIKTWSYQCLHKYREAWKTLIQDHLEAGHICPSSSSFASPAFLIPKLDPMALPCWVNDYRNLNAATVPDNHPIPHIEDILHDCVKGKIFAVLDLTNVFFQIPMHPDHMHLTAVSTPYGLYE